MDQFRRAGITYLPGRLNYAQWLLEHDEVVGARQECEAALQEFGDRPQVIAQLAFVERAEGNDRKALATAERAIEQGCAWSPVLVLRGELLDSLGQHDQAATALLEAYLAEPHAWHCLERYCQLMGRPFVAPLADPPSPIGPLDRLWLYASIEASANTLDDDGELLGCDHTLKHSRRWADHVGLDPIPLFQFLNGAGGFCDCEVSYNVEAWDSRFERLAVAGGVIGDGRLSREALLESGTVVEQGAPPTVVLPDDDDEFDDDEELAPILISPPPRGLRAALRRDPQDFKIWPQVVVDKAGARVGSLDGSVPYISAIGALAAASNSASVFAPPSVEPCSGGARTVADSSQHAPALALGGCGFWPRRAAPQATPIAMTTISPARA